MRGGGNAAGVSPDSRFSFDLEEMEIRLGNLREWMTGTDLDGLFIEAPSNVRYLSGFRGEPASLWVTRDRAVLMTSFRSEPWARAQTRTFEVRVEAEPLDRVNQWLGGQSVRIGVDSHISHRRLLALRDVWAGHGVEPTQAVEFLRRLKSEAEVELLRHSQVVNEGIFTRFLDQVRPGMTERSAQGIILTEMATLEEVEAPAFTPIIAAGRNAWEIHHQPDATVLREGDMVIVDLGVKVAGYASDMTRTICLGKATDRMREVHAKVREAQLAAMEMVRTGVRAAEVDAAAREVIESAGFGRGFTHGLGHGIGLDTHDADLRLNAGAGELKLEEGMALTLEPGIYLEEEFGVRTEDVVVVEKDGFRNLTTTSHELIELSF